jgi:hypothetical protein
MPRKPIITQLWRMPRTADNHADNQTADRQNITPRDVLAAAGRVRRNAAPRDAGTLYPVKTFDSEKARRVNVCYST